MLQALEDSTETLPTNHKKDYDARMRTNGVNSIPPDASDLQLNLLSITHSGAAGPWGVEATLHALTSNYRCKNRRGDTRAFIA